MKIKIFVYLLLLIVFLNSIKLLVKRHKIDDKYKIKSTLKKKTTTKERNVGNNNTREKIGSSWRK